MTNKISRSIFSYKYVLETLLSITTNYNVKIVLSIDQNMGINCCFHQNSIFVLEQFPKKHPTYGMAATKSATRTNGIQPGACRSNNKKIEMDLSNIEKFEPHCET